MMRMLPLSRTVLDASQEIASLRDDVRNIAKRFGGKAVALCVWLPFDIFNSNVR
jgi:hypothetical protein